MPIDNAMVLAAGLGTRFRDISGDRPKPLVPVAGKALIDWALDLLEGGGIDHAVANVHYQAEQVEAHLRGRASPRVTISDERDQLLETGGGLIRATPSLGGYDTPVVCSNTDQILCTGAEHPLDRLRDRWTDGEMDALLLIVPQDLTSGYKGKGDFTIAGDGRIDFGGDGERYVYTGLQIIHPRLWKDEAEEKKSTVVFWRKAAAEGRMYGVVHDARWLHVGDPDGYHAAEAFLADR